MKICIIKLGALGDLVRTLSILPALKNKFPKSEIYWITKNDQDSLLVFENNPYVKKVFHLPYESEQEFDLLYNFDIDKEATELAEKIKAKKKLGFYSQDNYPIAYNLASEYYLNTIFDDEIKRSNKKTYQQMIFEAAELEYNHEHCPIFLTKKDLDYAKDFVEFNKINTNKLIGIHLGASSRWPSKAWHSDMLKEFIIKAKQKGYGFLLFSGKQEAEKQKKLIKELEDKKIKVYSNNPNNTIKEFASLVNLCKKIICADSLALHVSLSLKKPTIALFFCTSPNEIEDYGLLKKIISPRLYDFFPQKSDLYDEKLVKSISAEEVLKVLEQ